ncbi:hypothetical protein PENSUB_1783 [Penicillium subrubescens]|uniref:Uncharacterized protein n=1 Tax=Penicillium subrubescens TaxID=1316194 RepID=A0A1Q5UJP5_9EURO|nr:hypothetical protein PENSUB_1783 [Penicillium subrubescens]
MVRKEPIRLKETKREYSKVTGFVKRPPDAPKGVLQSLLTRVSAFVGILSVIGQKTFFAQQDEATKELAKSSKRGGLR